MNSEKDKNYWEERARQILHYVCDFSLNEWIRADKSDLQSVKKHCGIEVVRDVHESEQKMQHFLETIWGQPLEKVSDKKIQRFEKYGGSLRIKDGIIQGASLGEMPSYPNHLIETIEKKVDLINRGGYKKFDRYGLYVFVETTFIDKNFRSFVQQTIDAIMEYQKCYSIKYDMLYLDQLYTLCVCDLQKGSFDHKGIPKEMRELIRSEVTNICPN